MADSKTKQIIDAINALLAAIEGALTVKADAPLPEDVPEDGLIIIREGDVQSSEETLGGFESAYVSQSFPVEIYVSSGDDGERQQKYDAVKKEIGKRLYADRTLGGLVYGLTIAPPQPVSEAVYGGPAVKAATLDVVIEYESGAESPIG